MIAAQQKDSRLLTDALASPEPAMWWLGQSGFLLRVGRHFAIIDPYLSDSLKHKYSGTGRPHVRMMERCVDPARLGFVTHALFTHGHTDHFDGESLRAIAAAEDRTEHLHLILTAKEQRAIAAKRQLAGG
jgi:L-ascorbate metabolism protein UlaG (beta-lactamase superfamily)